MFLATGRLQWSIAAPTSKLRLGRRAYCSAISPWPWMTRGGFCECFASRRGGPCFASETVNASRRSILAVILTTCSSTRSVTACTSPAAMERLMCFRMKQADISTSVDLRLHPARVPPCLFRTWIGCTSLYERLPRHRRPFGLSVRSHESSGSSLLGDQHELKTYRTGYG